MLIFVINLDSSKDRFNGISKKFKDLNLDFERVSAVNGKIIDENEIKRITYPIDHKSKVLFPRELTRGEIGCFLSHKKCWEKLINSNEQWAAIIEDDVKISKYATLFLKDVSWIPKDVKICKLSLLRDNIKCESESKELKVNDKFKLEIPLWPEPLGTQGYLISREVAQRAIALSNKIIAPVDNFLFSKWFQIARIYDIWSINPFIIKEDDLQESVIGDRNKNVKKSNFLLRHGFKRNKLDAIVDKKRRSNIKKVYEFIE